MKTRIFSLILALTFIAMALIGCSPKDGTAVPLTGTHVVTDHLGIEVEVPYQIDRIAVCDIYPVPSVLAVFFDSADKIVECPNRA